MLGWLEKLGFIDTKLAEGTEPLGTRARIGADLLEAFFFFSPLFSQCRLQFLWTWQELTSDYMAAVAVSP